MKAKFSCKPYSFQKFAQLFLILSIVLSSSVFAQTVSPITPSVTKSRTNGVAPLAIHFDATATTATTLTSRPFHDLEYRWNFGDEVVSTWAHGAQPGVLPKNEAFGPVAAHVYETAGTYNPTLQVRYRKADGSFDVVNYDCGAVTVTAADTEWAGTKTICVSSSGTFTGAPAGSTHVTSSDADAAIAAHIGSGNVRILFRAGETFDVGQTVSINRAGPSMIGSFGSGPKPILQSGIGARNSLMFSLSSGSTPTGVSDWRFSGLDIRGISGSILLDNASTVFAGGGSFSRVLIHDVDLSNIFYGVNLSGALINSLNTTTPFTHAMWDEFYIVDSSFYNLTPGNGPNSIFANARRSAVIGCDFDNNGGGEHGIRYQLLQLGVLSNNTVRNIAYGKTNMTIRGTAWAGNNTVPPGTYSENNVISSNKYEGVLGIGPQNEYSDERGRDMIVECNWWHFVGELNNSANINQRDVTIRNNIAYVPGNYGGTTFGAGPNDQNLNNTPTRVNVYNNSVYLGGTTLYGYGVFGLGSYGDFTMPDSVFEAYNNILYAPSDANCFVASNGPYNTSTLLRSNNTVNPQISPQFSSSPTLALTDFTPGAGSYAVSGGRAVAVCSDFYRRSTPTISHMGAIIPVGVGGNSVSYNGNASTSGNLPVDVKNYSTGESVTVLGNTGSLVRTGFRFDGWNTQADGLGTNYAAAASFTINANITLFAKWTPSAFQNWSSGALPTSDANNDGIANGIAWLLGAANPLVNATSLLPTSDNTDSNYFIYTYRRSDAANNDPGTTIMVEYGSTLTSWSTAVHDGTNIIITPTNDGYSAGVDRVEVRIIKTLAASGKLFTRIRLQTS